MSTPYIFPYSTDFMLKKLLGNFDTGTKKFKLVKPIFLRQNKKTIIVNFSSVCKSINREIESVRYFFEKELAMTSDDVTVSAIGELILTGSHADTNLIKHLEDYLLTYVMCSEKGCGSGNTELSKENRILWLLCKKCNCKKAIQK